MKRSAFKRKPTWKKLRHVSARRVREKARYDILSKQYLKDHPNCERCLKKGILKRSTENHHKRGRGIYYLCVQYFAALCFDCHVLCKSEANQMMQEGWIIDRIGIL